MKALIHPGEYVYAYEDIGHSSPQVSFCALVMVCYSMSVVVPEPLSRNGFASIVVHLDGNGQLEYLYEYSDSMFNQITRKLVRLENKDREQITSRSFIKQAEE